MPLQTGTTRAHTLLCQVNEPAMLAKCQRTQKSADAPSALTLLASSQLTHHACARCTGDVLGWTADSEAPCPADEDLDAWSFLECNDGVLTGLNFTSVNLGGG